MIARSANASCAPQEAEAACCEGEARAEREARERLAANAEVVRLREELKKVGGELSLL